jgi:hypothetical protein
MCGLPAGRAFENTSGQRRAIAKASIASRRLRPETCGGYFELTVIDGACADGIFG